MSPADALKKACTTLGGSAQLARKLKITQQAICQWKRVPVRRVRAVEIATHGAVTRYQLRPDIFGERP